MIHLGVNIDHVATLRNARGGVEPNPIFAAECAALGGADSITVHLREDRRHITDQDVINLSNQTHLPINLEMSIADEIVEFALKLTPPQVTLVPERREEKTTESGLDVMRHLESISKISDQFCQKGVRVSLFLDPDISQLEACLKTSARYVELHTGAYANAKNNFEKEAELERLNQAAIWCCKNKITLHAGHGLNYHNTYDILHLPKLRELNIGHSIVSRAVFVGLEQAVKDMRQILLQATTQEIILKSKSLFC